jgi:exopolysaccharide biosynthesis protein
MENKNGPRKKAGHKRINGAWLALVAIAVFTVSATGCGLASQGYVAVSASQSPASSALASIATIPASSPPEPAPSESPAPTASATPTPRPTDTPPPSPAPTAGPYFTDGEVLVDYAALTYRSADLYVKVTNVSGNGQNYYIADCRMKESDKFFTAIASEIIKGKKRLLTSAMAQAEGAVIAVNGDYFTARSQGIVIRNNKIYRKNPYHDVAAIYGDGTMKTFTKTQTTAGRLLSDGAAQAFSFGPMMLDGNGKVLKKFSLPAIWVTNPRTGIGYIEPDHFVLIVVDGRNPKQGRKGMKQAEFAQLFANLGCKSAYNLDGGGSATMVFMGKVINHPSDKAGERSVGDIAYFGESETDQANIDRINSR